MEQSVNPFDRDTICAVSTPPGVGGIAVIRVSGPSAINAVNEIWKGASLLDVKSHTVHLGSIIDPDDGTVLDQAVATVFRAPNSFTGDDVVELSVHGSSYVQQRLVRILTDGCRLRLAQPGEFTQRAFASGKLSLTQAEAVADMIASKSRAAHRIATTQFSGKTHSRLIALRDRLMDLTSLLELELDFSEEDVTFADRSSLLANARLIREEIDRLLRSFSAGQAIRDGIPVAIVGATNAGKSSLLNSLVDDDRAIVSDIHGTTRDTIEATATIGDYLFRFIDTAGIRDTDDTIERLGIERSRKAIASASVILLVMDASSPLSEETILAAEQSVKDSTGENNPLVVTLLNKIDLIDTVRQEELSNLLSIGPQDNSTPPQNRLCISTSTGTGLDTLRDLLAAHMASLDRADDIMITNERHRQQLAEARQSIDRVIDAMRQGLSSDLIAIDLRATIQALSMLTGDITTPQILNRIFSRFCIGK